MMSMSNSTVPTSTLPPLGWQLPTPTPPPAPAPKRRRLRSLLRVLLIAVCGVATLALVATSKVTVTSGRAGSLVGRSETSGLGDFRFEVGPDRIHVHHLRVRPNEAVVWIVQDANGLIRAEGVAKPLPDIGHVSDTNRRRHERIATDLLRHSPKLTEAYESSTPDADGLRPIGQFEGLLFDELRTDRRADVFQPMAEATLDYLIASSDGEERAVTLSVCQVPNQLTSDERSDMALSDASAQRLVTACMG